MNIINNITYPIRAIENKESLTGYVDLFGMSCVTPEQVEAGVIIEAKDWG